MKCLRCLRTRPILLTRTPIRSFTSLRPLASPAVEATPASTESAFPAGIRPNAPLAPSRRPQSSAKLAALHARLSLHPSFPIETLGRCLIDKSAEVNPLINNESLAYLGNNLLGYSTSEYLMTHYPRLPQATLEVAMWSYVGNKALAALGREWGVEAAFEPRPEVDAGLLQFRRMSPGDEPWVKWNMMKDVGKNDLLRETDEEVLNIPGEERSSRNNVGIPLEFAMAGFVKSVFAGVYLHEGKEAYQQFFKQHITSRHLDILKLFHFRQATRLLSRLCAREGFEQPIARLLSETGRHSRTPVFIVGIFSGNEMLAEGAGASLDEARRRAAANALIAYFTYSPPEGVRGDLPSAAREGEQFRPGVIDVGDLVA